AYDDVMRMAWVSKPWTWTTGVLATLVAAWIAGLFWFAATSPNGVADAAHTDAIVVLTGGTERIDTGLKLLADGLSDRLYISGVGGQLRHGDALALAMSDPKLGPHIALGTAGNTPGNAVETAAWARAEKVRSIRLVTAGYHM